MNTALAQAARYAKQVAQLENHGLIVEAMQVRTAWHHFLWQFDTYMTRASLRTVYDDVYWRS